MDISSDPPRLLSPPAPAGEPLARNLDPAVEHLDLWRLSARLWRRKLAIIAVALLIFLPATFLIFELTPLYHADAVVMIDGRKNEVLKDPSVLPGLTVPLDDPTSAVQSEMEVITSQRLAKRVVDKLDLVAVPEFNPSLRPPSPVARIAATAKKKLNEWISRARALIDPASAAVPAAAPPALDPTAEAVRIFDEQLATAALGRSRAIRISFESESPQRAMQIANTLADLYVADQREAKVAATETANAWLQHQSDLLRREVEKRYQDVERYRSDAGLLRGKDTTLIAQQISEVASQLTTARERESMAEARLTEMRRYNTSKGDDPAIPEILDSRHIQTLREQESELTRRRADLLTKYGPRYPKVAETDAELEQLRATIQHASDRIVQSLSNDVGRARADVERLAASLAGLRTRLSEANEATAHVTTLERTASSSDSLYQNLLMRLQQTGIEAAIQRPDSTVLSFAALPLVPYFPNKHTLLPLALLTSLIVSAAAVLALDSRKKGFFAPHELEGVLQSRSLGFIPTVKGLQRTVDTPRILAERSSRSAFAESIASVYVRLLVTSPSRPKTVVIASAVPGEGKTSTAIALALLQARSGRRAVIIDCDVRRPHLHDAFGLERSPGITDLLDGSAGSSEEVLHRVEDGVDIITAGTPVAQPAELIGSPRMRSLLDLLSGSYDLVILDTPPLMAVSDALILAALADKTLFVVRWAKTPRRVAARALKMLVEADARIGGTLLSLVRVDKMIQEDFEGNYDASIYRYYRP